MKCLVTGAGGFIGSALSRELDRRGHSLRLLYRTGSGALPGDIARAEVVAVELGREPVPPALLDGIDVVYHTAGIAHQSAAEEDYERVNHAATLELAGLAGAAGVSHFVFLSSVKATATDSAYGRWKLRTETALSQTHGASAMAVTSLRPALVYGPGVKGNLQSLIAAARFPVPLPPAGGSRSLVGLRDLVDVLCLLGEHPARGYACFEVTDGENYSTRRLVAAIRRGLNAPPGVSWLPRPGWRLACALLDLVRRGDGEGSYRKMFTDEQYSNAQLCAALGWQPRHTLEQDIEEILGASR